MILANDGMYRVSVEGQIDYPFETEQEANTFADTFRKQGFDVVIYHSPGKVYDQPKQ